MQVQWHKSIQAAQVWMSSAPRLRDVNPVNFNGGLLHIARGGIGWSKLRSSYTTRGMQNDGMAGVVKGEMRKSRKSKVASCLSQGLVSHASYSLLILPLSYSGCNTVQSRAMSASIDHAQLESLCNLGKCNALLLTRSPVRRGTLVGGIRQAVLVLLALRNSIIRQSAQVVLALPSGTYSVGGQIAGSNIAGADVDGARIGAVEVGGPRRVVGKGEIRLTLGDDVGLVFA